MLDESRPDLSFPGRAAWMNRLYADAEPQAVIRATLAAFPGQVALVSSFGADSAVLLHLLAQVDPDTPVLLVDTGMLFAETLAYRRDLGAALGLRQMHRLSARPPALARDDPDGRLHACDADACCRLRKVAPLDAARARFPVLINGRKRHQAASRAHLQRFEADHAGLSVNPLADWDARALQRYRHDHALPPHPLAAQGYGSIGCAPCTSPVAAGEDPRAGRWRGQDKVECGIHFGAGGTIRRAG